MGHCSKGEKLRVNEWVFWRGFKEYLGSNMSCGMLWMIGFDNQIACLVRDGGGGVSASP
jgi:hypothetical protein